MRLIDADALFEPDENSDRILVFVPRSGKSFALATALLKQKVMDATTIEAEPVKHGLWEQRKHKIFGNSYDYVCSACGCDYALAKYKYCPNCGAKMDLEVSE